jgi:hypothetical protein
MSRFGQPPWSSNACGKSPVIQRRQRPDLHRDQFIRQALVVIQSSWVRLARAVRLNPRPGNGKTVALEIQLLRNRHILFVAMIRIASYVARFRAFTSPTVCEKRSQIDSLFPSTFHAPSI